MAGLMALGLFAAIGLALMVMIFRNRQSIDVDKVSSLRG